MREYNFQNLTVSWSQPNPKSGICVCSGSALGLLRQTESWPQANPQMDPKLTPSRSQADPEQTQKADPKRKHGVWSNHDNKKKKTNHYKPIRAMTNQISSWQFNHARKMVIYIQYWTMYKSKLIYIYKYMFITLMSYIYMWVFF